MFFCERSLEKEGFDGLREIYPQEQSEMEFHKDWWLFAQKCFADVAQTGTFPKGKRAGANRGGGDREEKGEGRGVI